MSREFFVSTSGNDDKNPGTLAQPFGTIAKGVSCLQPGDILNLRQGIYVEPVDIRTKWGTPEENIVIRSYPGEHAYIDGSLSNFRKANQPTPEWEPACRYDPRNAHSEEYVSVETFTPPNWNDDQYNVNRGAFLERNPYTRLITYSNLNDLRAENETFEKITSPDPARPGPEVMVECDRDDPDPECVLYPNGKRYKPAGYRHPWVYMGPGIWFNRNRESPTAGKVHIRLSHTHNNINGLADYTGEVDPNKVKLAITRKDMTTLQVHNCKYLRFENLSIRYGGEWSILLRKVEGVVFDHVRIWATTRGVSMGEKDAEAKNTIFRHCEFNGGLPTWLFRSDLKNDYYGDDGGKIVHDIQGKQTVDILLLGNPNDTGTQIYNCEFHNAHDIYLIGNNLSFHHNWINNLNDEGPAVDYYPKAFNMQIYQNVILKTLSAISFAGAHEEGQWYIYRNLIDLRGPTAGYRPRRPDDDDRQKYVWRYGHFHKNESPDGPHHMFQNTFLVYGQARQGEDGQGGNGAQASFIHYRDTSKKTSGNHLRRSFNNMFIAVNPDANSDIEITFIPSPSFPGPTDGNNYYRMGVAKHDPYRYLEYWYNDEPPCPQPTPEGCRCKPGTFPNLDALRCPPSLLFSQSKSQYPPGYEANSCEKDPQFRRIGSDGRFRETDDLRLGDNSPAIGAGVALRDIAEDLYALDPFASDNPDIGCYPRGSGPLQVGVDSRRSYPRV
jgi:hypothetical protein